MEILSRNFDAESEYWDKRIENEGSVPDIRKVTISKDIFYIWDDPVIEDILRGEYRRFIISKASENRGGNVLDIGCGTGWLSLELARAGMNVTGVDMSKKRITIAQKYLKKLKKLENVEGNINYIACPIQMVSFEKSVFDLIVTWDSLHHIPDIELIIKKMTEWLKPDGKLIIFEHIGACFWNKIVIMIIFTLPVISKIKILRKLRSKVLKKAATQKAPFEGITKLEMLCAIKKYLEVQTFKTALAISYYVAPYVYGNKVLRYKIIKFFKRIDDAIIKLRFLRGEYIFMWARKR